MKVRLLVLPLCILFGTTMAKAQNVNLGISSNDNPHVIKLAVSDGLTLGVASFWGMGLGDAITGTQRSDQRSSGVFSIGYRYSINKFRVGLDFGFAKISSKTTIMGDKTPSIKEKELNFMVLPTLEYAYYKRRLIELYGSASAGVNFERQTKSVLTEVETKIAGSKSNMNTNFAYQINPIGIRIGNSRIGGFVEAGLGYKGFVTAGLSLGF